MCVLMTYGSLFPSQVKKIIFKNVIVKFDLTIQTFFSKLRLHLTILFCVSTTKKQNKGNFKFLSHNSDFISYILDIFLEITSLYLTILHLYLASFSLYLAILTFYFNYEKKKKKRVRIVINFRIARQKVLPFLLNFLSHGGYKLNDLLYMIWINNL